MHFYFEAGLFNVFIKSNNSSVVNWCFSKLSEPLWDCHGHVIVYDMISLLASGNASLSFVPGEANKAANDLARYV